MDKKALWEAAKEFARVSVLAALPVIADAVATNTFDWKLTGIAALVAGLRAIDRYIHESKDVNATGLVPF